MPWPTVDVIDLWWMLTNKQSHSTKLHTNFTASLFVKPSFHILQHSRRKTNDQFYLIYKKKRMENFKIQSRFAVVLSVGKHTRTDNSHIQILLNHCRDFTILDDCLSLWGLYNLCCCPHASTAVWAEIVCRRRQRLRTVKTGYCIWMISGELILWLTFSGFQKLHCLFMAFYLNTLKRINIILNIT